MSKNAKVMLGSRHSRCVRLCLTKVTNKPANRQCILDARSANRIFLPCKLRQKLNLVNLQPKNYTVRTTGSVDQSL